MLGIDPHTLAAVLSLTQAGAAIRAIAILGIDPGNQPYKGKYYLMIGFGVLSACSTTLPTLIVAQLIQFMILVIAIFAYGKCTGHDHRAVNGIVAGIVLLSIVMVIYPWIPSLH